jgi:hypothetical protein
MQIKLPIFLAIVILFLMPNAMFSQAPSLGITSSFALFTSVGAIDNVGTTTITGDIGTNSGALTGFPPAVITGGTSYVANATSLQASTDVAAAYTYLAGITGGTVIGVGLGNGQVLTAGTYKTGAVTTLNGNLILDGQNNPNAVFIFQIDAAFSTATASNIIMINSASLCNVFWQINGAVDLGANSVFRGTIIANGAINLLQNSSLIGRGLTKSGAINLNTNSIAVGKQPTASIATAGGPITFCQGGNVVLSGNIGGVWSNGAITPDITVNTSGDYSITNTNSCSITSNHIIVTVNPLPTATTGSNKAICSGNNVTIGAASVIGNSYAWTPAAGLSDANIANPIASPSLTTTYTLTETITATGCSMTNSVTVTVGALPNCTITGNSAICQGSTTQLCVAGFSTYLWGNGETTACIDVSTAATYTVTVTNASGCNSSCNKVISVNPLPLALTGNNAILCNGNSVTLGVAAIVGHTYSWTPTTGLSSATISNPIANPLVMTTYTLTETVTVTGCQKTNSVIVNPHPTCSCACN